MFTVNGFGIRQFAENMRGWDNVEFLTGFGVTPLSCLIVQVPVVAWNERIGFITKELQLLVSLLVTTGM